MRSCGLTFDMSGGPKGAKRPLERPLDEGVRRLVERRCIAFSTSERLSKRFGTAFGRDDPWTIGPWRIVANVLVVPTLELGNPMLLFVLVEPDDPSIHGEQDA